MISKLTNNISFSRQQQKFDNKVAFGLDPSITGFVLDEVTDNLSKSGPMSKRDPNKPFLLQRRIGEYYGLWPDYWKN